MPYSARAPFSFMDWFIGYLAFYLCGCIQQPPNGHLSTMFLTVRRRLLNCALESYVMFICFRYIATREFTPIVRFLYNGIELFEYIKIEGIAVIIFFSPSLAIVTKNKK